MIAALHSKSLDITLHILNIMCGEHSEKLRNRLTIQLQTAILNGRLDVVDGIINALPDAPERHNVVAYNDYENLRLAALKGNISLCARLIDGAGKKANARKL